MKFLNAILIIIISLLWLKPVNTSMTGGDFEIYADSFNVVSTVSTTGGNYIIYDTLGDSFATTSIGNTFTLKGGFQAQDKTILSFNISSSTLNLGELSTSIVSSGSVILTITSAVDNGYTIAVSEDGDLRSGTDTIDDVSDGSVTAGSEEYGISTSGADGLLSSDTAISGSVSLATGTGRPTLRQTTVNFEASASLSTPAGSYSQSVTFTATVNP